MGSAATGHVETSKAELHNSAATWTRLPSLTCGKRLERFIRCADATPFTWVSRFLTSGKGIYKTAGTFDTRKG